jgi:outer membrane protein OmpA-like peptidoglycan-associated protein
MKKLLLTLLVAFFAMLIIQPCKAQIEDPGKKVENEGENRANENVDKGINKGFDGIEDGIGSLFKKKNKKGKKEKNEPPVEESTTSGTSSEESSTPDVQEVASDKKSTPLLIWSKYDFVPGDKIIFEDDLIGEENGEFPSRWDLYSGSIENAVFGGENVIMFRGRQSNIIPYLKNPETDYLPDVFTIEFDFYFNSALTIYFYDAKNQNRSSEFSNLDIGGENMVLHPAKSNLPDGGSIRERWAHISIAYTSGKMKAYIDETRLINIPHLPFNPTGISLYTGWTSDESPNYIKNFRIAEGGVKYYDKFLQDGKIVSNGIRFDVGKATLRPESMGVLNGIYDLLSEHPEINFSIEGHTDSDSDFDFNQKLSEERAKTVMNQLISMGINAGRLSSKGFGESKPINTNDTPEGKAANRRVEFVKI